MRLIILLCGLFLTVTLYAQDRPVKDLGSIRVYYSAYKTTFLEPRIAEAYDIVRARDRGVVNISAVAEDSPYGMEAEVEGVASNLMAVRQELDFFEIQEGDAVYYLAPFEFRDEEALTFDVEVRTPDGTTGSVNFQQRFYIDR